MNNLVSLKASLCIFSASCTTDQPLASSRICHLVGTFVPICDVHVLYILCLVSSGLVCLGCNMSNNFSCIIVLILVVAITLVM